MSEASSLKTLAFRVRSFAAAKGWSDRDTAKAAKIHPVQLSKYLTEKQAPSITVLDKLAKALGTTPAELLQSNVAELPVLPAEYMTALRSCDKHEREAVLSVIEAALVSFGKLERVKAKSPSR